MRVARTFDDVNTIFREVLDRLDDLRTRDFEMAGRRIHGLSPSIESRDAVNRSELANFTDYNRRNDDTIQDILRRLANMGNDIELLQKDLKALTLRVAALEA